MSTFSNLAKNLIKKMQQNAVEVWATLSIFVGIPLVAWLYFDYRAALLVFVLASSVIGTLAVRNK